MPRINPYPAFLFAAMLCLLPQKLRAEWGAEAALGANPTSFYTENLRKNNSSFQSEITGRRHALSFTGKIYYEWVGLRFWSDYYFDGTGKQKTRSRQQTMGQNNSEQTTEQEGVPFSAAQTYRAEIQLRKFYYGHREFFAFNTGLLYRKVVTDLAGQPADYSPASLLNRYLTLGISFEPLLTNFGRFELSLPLEFSLGLKFPEGGIFDGGGPGAVLLAGGLRLQHEPRGIFFVTQGVVNFFDTPYTANGANYNYGQTEITIRMLVGYYFRNTLYNE